MYRIKKTLYIFLPILILSLAMQNSFAKDKTDPLKVEMVGYLVTTEIVKGKAKEKLSPLPENIEPGSVVMYKINCTNESDGNLKNISVVGAVPTSMTYLNKSVSSTKKSKTLFSIDFGDSYSKTPMIKTTNEKGKEVLTPADPKTYTNIQFTIGKLKSTATVTHSYKVRVK